MRWRVVFSSTQENSSGLFSESTEGVIGGLRRLRSLGDSRESLEDEPNRSSLHADLTKRTEYYKLGASFTASIYLAGTVSAVQFQGSTL